MKFGLSPRLGAAKVVAVFYFCFMLVACPSVEQAEAPNAAADIDLKKVNYKIGDVYRASDSRPGKGFIEFVSSQNIDVKCKDCPDKLGMSEFAKSTNSGSKIYRAEFSHPVTESTRKCKVDIELKNSEQTVVRSFNIYLCPFDTETAAANCDKEGATSC